MTRTSQLFQHLLDLAVVSLSDHFFIPEVFLGGWVAGQLEAMGVEREEFLFAPEISDLDSVRIECAPSSSYSSNVVRGGTAAVLRREEVLYARVDRLWCCCLVEIRGGSGNGEKSALI